jgi:hypothetical protein
MGTVRMLAFVWVTLDKLHEGYIRLNRRHRGIVAYPPLNSLFCYLIPTNRMPNNILNGSPAAIGFLSL